MLSSVVEFIDLKGTITEDPRGASFFPWQSRDAADQEVLRTFHLVSITPGHTRGHHLHPGHEEWLYLFHGAGVLIWEPSAGEIKEQAVSGGRTLIRIPPGVAHAVRNPGPEMLYLFAWREAAGGGSVEPETVPRHLGGGS